MLILIIWQDRVLLLMCDAILSLTRENSFTRLVSNEILCVNKLAKEVKKQYLPNASRLLSNIAEIKVGDTFNPSQRIVIKTEYRLPRQ
jgi:hypothetical protein